MNNFTFIHAADLHLGAPFRGITSSIGQDARNKHFNDIIQNATFIALDRLVTLCEQEGADALLLAGDTYNANESSLKTHLALRDAFTRLAENNTTVFLVHGNHDPLSSHAKTFDWPENVVVFNGQGETHTCSKDGVPLAIIHGISHTGPEETRNLAKELKKANFSGTYAVPQIGVLHCALEGQSGAHKYYAPCSLQDLYDTDLDYIALGHVHTCALYRPGHSGPLAASSLDGQSNFSLPLVGYSGSTQGLHINEIGEHGCLVVRINGTQKATVNFKALAPLEWEYVTLALDELEEDVETIPALEALILERLPTAFSPARTTLTDQARIIRLVLTGHSPLDAALRQKNALDDLFEHLVEQVTTPGIRLQDIQLRTKPMLDLAVTADGSDLRAEIARLAQRLMADDELLAQEAVVSLANLEKNPRLRKLHEQPSPEELKNLVQDATLLCLSLLEAK